MPAPKKKPTNARAKANTNPLVSIVIPAYNTEDYLNATIDSALKQTYPNVEVLVLDDGSKDGTDAIARRYGDRIRFFPRAENWGITRTLNEAVTLAKGEFVIFFDADDILMPVMIERMMEQIAAHPDADFAYCRHIVFYNETGIEKLYRFNLDYPKTIGRETLPRLVQGNFLKLSEVLVRRSVFSEGIAFDTAIRYAGDWDMWLQLAAAGKHGVFCDEPLFYCRIHGGGLSGSSQGKFNGKLEAIEIIRKWEPRLTEEERRLVNCDGLVRNLRMKSLVNAIGLPKGKGFDRLSARDFSSPKEKAIFASAKMAGAIIPSRIFSAIEKAYYQKKIAGVLTAKTAGKHAEPKSA